MNECVVLEFDPPCKLAYSWLTVFDEEMKKERPSRVTFIIESAEDCTKLTVTHEGFAEDSKTLPSISSGWPRVLSNLKSFLETGQPIVLDPVKDA